MYKRQVQPLQIEEAIKAFAEQMIVLADSVQRFIVFNGIIFTIRAIHTKHELVDRCFYAGFKSSGGQQRVAVSLGERKTRQDTAFPSRFVG